jgi:type II secretory pathway component PulF
MRYRTALILSAVIIAGMFALPMTIEPIANHYIQTGSPIPLYMRLFFGVSVVLIPLRWILAPATVGALIFIAALTADSRPKQTGNSMVRAIDDRK